MNPISLLTAATLDRIIAGQLAHTFRFRMMEEASRIGEAIGIPATVSVEEMFDGARAARPYTASRKMTSVAFSLIV
jgi:2-dehydropantoate 2-reductase